MNFNVFLIFILSIIIITIILVIVLNLSTDTTTIVITRKKWVAVGNDNPDSTNNILWSYDGISWFDTARMEEGGSPFGLDFGSDIAYGDSKWIAVGNGDTVTKNILWSNDAITWYDTANVNGTSVPFDGGIGYGVCWNGDIWVAVGNDSNGNTNNILWSSDGVSWFDNANVEGISTPFGNSGEGRAVHWNGSSWISVGNGGGLTNNILWSSDGISWFDNANVEGISTPFTSKSLGEGRDIIWNGSSWFAVGKDASPYDTNNILWSTDGISWFDNAILDGISTPFGEGVPGGKGIGIAWNGTSLVSVGQGELGTNNIIWSSDGVSWFGTANINNGVPFGELGGGEDIAWNGISWIAVGDGSGSTNNILWSSDGISWFDTANVDGLSPFGDSGVGYGITYE